MQSPPSVSLLEPLRFTSHEQPSTAVAVLSVPPTHLRKHDVVQFISGPALLVLDINGRCVLFGRAPVKKRREFGGTAYRRWTHLPIEEYPEAIWPPAPRRARPLVRQVEAWPEVIIPSGTAGVIVAQSFAEGSSIPSLAV